jgi:hypothetical protein
MTARLKTLPSFRIAHMIIRLIALLLVAPACLAQTNESPTTSTPLNDIPALTAQANQGNVDAQLKMIKRDFGGF